MVAYAMLLLSLAAPSHLVRKSAGMAASGTLMTVHSPSLMRRCSVRYRRRKWRQRAADAVLFAAAGGAAALACRQNAQRRLLRKGGHPILLLRHHTWDGTGAQVVLRQRLATAIRCGCCGLRHRSDWGDARDKGISLVLCCSLRHRPLTMLVDGGCMPLSVRLRWIVCS